MLVLGIESSCDETGLALVECKQEGERVVGSVRGEVLASQHQIHDSYGGVVPELAAREHLRALPVLLQSLCETSGVTLSQIEGIGVTRGPGLVGCLLMGLHFAAGLSSRLQIPWVGVNHIEGHILAPLLDHPELTFPYLALVVSGGHTELHVVRGVGRYELLQRTLDDAAGEAFDKAAFLLGFPYPGGPKLARAADTFGGEPHFKLPKVMTKRPGFSFSGLKTAISLLVEREQSGGGLSEPLQTELAAAVQRSIIEVLVRKVTEAARSTRIHKIIVTGGVSANQALRRAVQGIILPGRVRVESYFPALSHCVDNGAMIGFVGGLRMGSGSMSDMEPLSRWPVEGLSSPRRFRIDTEERSA
jgi:N6-L-threonylcarbamoyladenine synthase